MSTPNDSTPTDASSTQNSHVGSDAGFGTFRYRVTNLKGESRIVRALFPKTARDVSGYGDSVLRIDGPLGVGIWPELGRLLMGDVLPTSRVSRMAANNSMDTKSNQSPESGQPGSLALNAGSASSQANWDEAKILAKSFLQRTAGAPIGAWSTVIELTDLLCAHAEEVSKAAVAEALAASLLNSQGEQDTQNP